MVIAKLYLFLSFLLGLAAIQGICAVQFNVIDLSAGTPGGARFAKEVGVEYTRETMISSTNFIWNFLQLYNNVDRKNFTNVTLFVEKWIKGAAAVTLVNQINVSAVYIEQCACNIKFDFTGLIYHEMTHVWQWNGEGQTPGGLVEGIAQFIRLKAHYAPPNFGKPGDGDRWDQGHDITARFLEYCENLRHGFVMQLNKKMRTSFNVHYFVELLGKPVDQLWREYKAKYGH